MDCQVFDAGMLADVIRELEETVEKANLLALEMALRALDEEEPDGSPRMDQLGEIAGRAACATDEVERLVRRLKAA